jgi:hypothetical protein
MVQLFFLLDIQFQKYIRFPSSAPPWAEVNGAGYVEQQLSGQ